jgi:hypothetical protein
VDALIEMNVLAEVFAKDMVETLAEVFAKDMGIVVEFVVGKVELD